MSALVDSASCSTVAVKKRASGNGGSLYTQIYGLFGRNCLSIVLGPTDLNRY